MHWIQGEKPVEYHVVRWDNSAFHNHDKRPERKMLGGVSFDGGAGGGRSSNTQQTGVQMAQPSFSHTVDEGWLGNSMAETGVYGDGDGGAKGRLRGNWVSGGRDTLEVKTASELVENKAAFEMAELKNVVGAAAASLPVTAPKEKRSRLLLKIIRKAESGIQTFLQGMEQKAGQKNGRKFPKKNTGGTRVVTKEEFDRIQEDKSYLLDSYNKYGERSTLGR